MYIHALFKVSSITSCVYLRIHIYRDHPDILVHTENKVVNYMT